MLRRIATVTDRQLTPLSSDGASLTPIILDTPADSVESLTPRERKLGLI